MTRRPPPMGDYEERRNARIRQLREQREGPVRRRRRVEPLLLLAWIAGSIVLLVVAIWFGFNAFFAPRVMAWVENNPGAIQHGIVQDFVEWYQPDVLTDEPASDQQERTTVTIAPGATDTGIGRMLYEQGLVRSEIAFQWAVIQAGRGGTLAAGTYDLFPTMRPSEIVATLRGLPFGDTTRVTLREGLRLEEIVAAFAASEMTMNMEELASLLMSPPPDLLNQYEFLADLPAGRSLEGYILPETLEYEINDSPREAVERLLNQLRTGLTDDILAGIAANGLTLDEAIIIASIVEREAVIDGERPQIAAVYMRRYLEPDNQQTVGLLNADPTLQYGLMTAEALPVGHPLLPEGEAGATPVDQWGSVNWWPQLMVTGGEVPIPDWLASFQTYLNPGIPETPIASPRIGSLEAVANAPMDEGYLFFVAGCPDGTRDGSHYFAATLDEHNANIQRANEECAGQ
ncbi:MAG TPA: endolytic transglycosylase MltG [Candidatus Limnocylindrales bacterium]|nr:endolytic transglycosylase MltG [Candidatus Limnocylindrales bacterium]